MMFTIMMMTVLILLLWLQQVKLAMMEGPGGSINCESRVGGILSELSKLIAGISGQRSNHLSNT